MKSKHFTLIAIVIMAIGIIFGIVLGNVCQVNVEAKWYNSAKYVFNAGLMIETWMFAGLISLFFGWLSSVLKKFENIENKLAGREMENNNFLQDIKNITASAKEKIEKQYEILKTNTSPDNYAPQTDDNNTVSSASVWYCPNCGKKHQGDLICDCGTKKP